MTKLLVAFTILQTCLKLISGSGIREEVVGTKGKSCFSLLNIKADFVHTGLVF
jgi:hypothetical protein